ncbi:MAG: bifunctional 4-hydroxy-3-methylbut-2-enyl diphosphate reductase/30S ribosomal protein S1 [Clostridia bacterium]|nr:bifunctional 4-hydroxy-3-methylbut-2-enyl diphosphate reductase/30S ribosomal protein S1 [Clostridia bacterium]
MEIIRADNSGFCFGVKQAIKKTEEQIGLRPGRIFTMGPLIHNELVTGDLKKRGVEMIASLDEVEEGDTVIVRSHGEPRSFFDDALAKGIRLVDATCPIVSHIHKLVEEAGKNGKKVLIVGDPSHQEVIATAGWCTGEVRIIRDGEDAAKVEPGEYYLVCQTTIRKALLDEVVEILKSSGSETEVVNTICNATTLRQESCAELAKKVDAMVIVGGRNSSNTRKLFEIADQLCENAFFAEKIEDLPLKALKKYSKIGVAAGASTPESIIEEVIANMSDTNEKTTMADFMEEIDASLKLPRNGEIVDGKVHQVTDKEVIVNIGCKKDGVLPLDEVSLEEGQTLADVFKEGDEIQAKVIKTDEDGSILLSKKKLEMSAHWAEIIEAHENRTPINVKVKRAVNGGVIAEYKEVSGFIPMSQLSDRYVEAESVDEFIGQSFDVKVTRVDQRRNRAVFSHKIVLLEEKQKQIADIWEKLNVGDVVEGTVMRFTDYGAFVDIGGIDGLLHISEISWGKLKHPQEVLAIGDRIKVKVLSMNQEKGKISLGLKQITPEPWSVINEKYEVGTIITGKVVQLKEYGAFVELEPGLDGLVHISEVAHKRVTDIAEELKVGQVVNAKILDIDTERKRISLSIKAAIDEVGEPEQPAEEAPAAVEEPETAEAPEVVEEAVEAAPTEE